MFAMYAITDTRKSIKSDRVYGSLRNRMEKKVEGGSAAGLSVAGGGSSLFLSAAVISMSTDTRAAAAAGAV